MRDCPSQGQPRLTYSEEDFDYAVNPLGHCWKCNQPGHVRIKCPKLGQSRTSYRRGKDEDICCYNCNEWGHYSRDCLLPKKTGKEQRFPGVEDKFKVMKESNWIPEDFTAKETKEERSISSSINVNVKPGENNLLSNVSSLQHRVNNLRIEKKKTSFAWFKVKQRNLFGLALINMGNSSGRSLS